MSSSDCCFLTWIQIFQEASKVVWYSHLFQNFPQFTVIHTIKGFGIVNKAEVDVFLEFFGFFNDPVDFGNLISGSYAFSKSSWNMWKFTVHVLLKPGLENFEHYFASVYNECNYVVVWTFFGIAFLWDWNENWPFPVLGPLLRFPNLLAYWVQHFNSIMFVRGKKFFLGKNSQIFLYIYYTYQICVYKSFCILLEKEHLKKDREIGKHKLNEMGNYLDKRHCKGLSWWLSGKESICQCRRHEFNPWSEKKPHAAGQLSPSTATNEPVF